MQQRDELQELLNIIAFPETPEERDAAEKAIHEGWGKRPYRVEWGIFNKWTGCDVYETEEDARYYFDRIKKNYPEDEARLVKRIAASEPGEWEEITHE